jgi:hypothetical protein
MNILEITLDGAWWFLGSYPAESPVIGRHDGVPWSGGDKGTCVRIVARNVRDFVVGIETLFQVGRSLSVVAVTFDSTCEL